ncbi:hypothetical protein, partial [Lentzea aerocolonigenes]|uniref:hypothetical protein n=1 Tax=Lentzea aerocolonigenes TaxID=68170 RepID=UPI001F20FB6F
VRWAPSCRSLVACAGRRRAGRWSRALGAVVPVAGRVRWAPSCRSLVACAGRRRAGRWSRALGAVVPAVPFLCSP